MGKRSSKMPNPSASAFVVALFGLWSTVRCEGVNNDGGRRNDLAVIPSQRLRRTTTTSQESSNNDNDEDSCFACHIKRLEPSFEPEVGHHVEEHFSCIRRQETGGYRVYLDISLSPAFQQRHGQHIDQGAGHFCIPGAHVQGRAVVVPDESKIKHVPRNLLHRRRSLQDNDLTSAYDDMMQQDIRFKGALKLLAVRVTSMHGEFPEETVEQIEAAIFGTGTTNPEYVPQASIVSQYADVSHGQLQFVPATGHGIVNGVAEIELMQKVQGSRVQVELTANILEETSRSLGPLDQLADRIIFCLPNQSTLQGRDTWTAFTYLLEPYSFYQQTRCTKLSVAMHELGHSFGFRHSGYLDSDYGDESGYMGYAKNLFGFPRKAFNAHKHWISGWFEDRAVHLDPEAMTKSGVGSGYQLMSFVDYNHPDLTIGDEAKVVLRVGSDLFVHFNVARDYNSDTIEDHRNQVVVTKAPGPLEVSVLQDSLASGEKFVHQSRVPDHNQTASTSGRAEILVIEVCATQIDENSDGVTTDRSLLDFALVSIHLGDQFSLCDYLRSKYLPTGPKSAGTHVNSTDASSSSTATDGDEQNVANDDDDAALGDMSGPAIVEDVDGPESSASSSGDYIVISFVWTLVGVLVVVAFAMVWRFYRMERKHHAAKTLQSASPEQAKQRHPHHSQKREVAKDENDKRDAPNSSPPSVISTYYTESYHTGSLSSSYAPAYTGAAAAGGIPRPDGGTTAAPRDIPSVIGCTRSPSPLRPLDEQQFEEGNPSSAMIGDYDIDWDEYAVKIQVAGDASAADSAPALVPLRVKHVAEA